MEQLCQKNVQSKCISIHRPSLEVVGEARHIPFVENFLVIARFVHLFERLLERITKFSITLRDRGAYLNDAKFITNRFESACCLLW